MDDMLVFSFSSFTNNIRHVLREYWCSSQEAESRKISVTNNIRHVLREYWCSSQEAESREISVTNNIWHVLGEYWCSSQEAESREISVTNNIRHVLREYWCSFQEKESREISVTNNIRYVLHEYWCSSQEAESREISVTNNIRHVLREYWCSSQEAESREISVSCKNLFLNQCATNMFKLQLNLNPMIFSNVFNCSVLKRMRCITEKANVIHFWLKSRENGNGWAKYSLPLSLSLSLSLSIARSYQYRPAYTSYLESSHFFCVIYCLALFFYFWHNPLWINHLIYDQCKLQDHIPQHLGTPIWYRSHVTGVM